MTPLALDKDYIGGGVTVEEYLRKAIETSIATRKIKKIIIEEENKNFISRPQFNTFICSPFGSGKSTDIGENISEVLGKDLVYREDFTKPGFLGTIDRNGRFIPGTVFDLGGKVLLIDEWNNISWDGQDALLGPLENQKISRQLGFSVKRRVEVKNDFSDLSVKANLISGWCRFSTIAFSLYFTIRGSKTIALFSRFCPIFLNPTKEDITDMLKGKKIYDFKDYGRVIENVIVMKKPWSEFIDAANNYLNEKGIYPKEKGFFTRATNDSIRFAIRDILKENKDDKTLTIGDSEILVKQLPLLKKQLSMFQKVKRTMDRFKELLNDSPNQTNKWYAERLNVSEAYIKKMKGKLKLENGRV